MSSGPLKTTITKYGQSYFDQLVIVKPKIETPIAVALRDLFGRPPLMPLVTGFDRMPLIWKKKGKKSCR